MFISHCPSVLKVEGRRGWRCGDYSFVRSFIHFDIGLTMKDLLLVYTFATVRISKDKKREALDHILIIFVYL